MYTDHRKGFDEERANIAKTVLLLRRINRVNVIHREFDEYGDVIRDYKKELEAYVKDEEENMLPQVTADYFNSFQRAYIYRETQKDFVSDVQVVPQLPRYKVVAKKSLLQKVIATIKSPYPRISYALRTFF